MPAYEFENAKHGVHVILHLPVKGLPARLVLKRRTVPSNVTVGVGARPPSFSQKLADGYKKVEERGGLQGKGGNYLDPKTVKRALAMPDTD